MVDPSNVYAHCGVCAQAQALSESKDLAWTVQRDRDQCYRRATVYTMQTSKSIGELCIDEPYGKALGLEILEAEKETTRNALRVDSETL